MARKEIIEEKLQTLNLQFLKITDQSLEHVGHAGNLYGKKETHFQVEIAFNELNTQTRIQQHRTINQLLEDEFSNGLHALSIVVKKHNI